MAAQPQPRARLAFGPYEVDTDAGELRKRGIRVRLSGQPFQILLVLLAHPGEVVTREQLREEVWGAGTFVDFEHGLNAAVNKLRRALGDSAENPRFVETLAKRGYRFIAPVEFVGYGSIAALQAIPPALQAGDLTDSIAVLPFENAGVEAGMEYLCDGIAEALINRLTQFSRLRVVPRSTAFRYRDCEDSLEAGRDLHVRLVLAGRVLQAGESLSLQIELVDTSRCSQVWGEHFKRKVSDLFDLQEEIVSGIAKRFELEDEGSERLRQRPPNRDAYHLLVRGNYYTNKWSPEGIAKGLEYARQAIEADPAYADAHSLLGYVYSMLGYFGVLSPKDAFPRAKAAAIRALALDDANAAGHFTLGLVHFLYEWEWSGSETEIKRGLSLAPNDAAGQFLYGEWLVVMNRLDEALARIERALDLNPLSSAISVNLASVYYLTGQTDRALEQARKTIELDPSFVAGPAFFAVLLARLGRYEEAIAKARACQSMPGSDLRGRSTLAQVYAMAGRRAEALEIAGSLEAEPPIRKLNSNLPHIYGVLGLREKALGALEQQYEERVSSLLFARHAPELISVRDDPRFAELLCRIGLPPLPLTAKR
jgi:TolB-like protein/Flp pilus assembly protein TadD